MDSAQRQQANKYIDLFNRQKTLIILIFLLSLPLGLAVYFFTPKVYQSTSLLSYQQQAISPNKLSPDVESRIRDIVSTLTQIVTSRTNLESLIVNLDLYPEQREELPTEDVIEILREKIEIEPSKRGDVFTISYSGSDPDKVVRVTNELASKFIEENLKYRQERATETSSYTNEELQMAKKVMDKQENSMRDYKLKFYNEMPDQREVNMSALTSLQEQYQGKQDSIQELGRTLVLIQDQLSNRKKIVKNVLQTTGDATGGNFDELVDGQISKYEQLEKMNARLDSLLMKYTEKHPETKRVRKIIANLEKDLEMEPKTADSQKDSNGNSASLQFDKTIMELTVQRKNIELNITNIEQEKEQLKRKINQYEQWVAAAPIREAEWSALTREYGQLKRHYDYLVAQDLEAKSMLNLERRQKGSQFRIEDPARFPEKPIKPNFFKIVGLSALVGMGFGLGLTLVFDFFDSSFRDSESLESALGVPLLTTVPYVETDEERKADKFKQIITIFILILITAGVASLFAGAWVRGYIVI